MCSVPQGTQLAGEGNGEGQFQYPYAMVVNGDEVLVTDHSNERVQVFGLDGSYVRTFAAAGQRQSGPLGIAASEGEVFVSSKHRVQVFR